jgi:hypothetical protein
VVVSSGVAVRVSLYLGNWPVSRVKRVLSVNLCGKTSKKYSKKLRSDLRRAGSCAVSRASAAFRRTAQLCGCPGIELVNCAEPALHQNHSHARLGLDSSNDMRVIAFHNGARAWRLHRRAK